MQKFNWSRENVAAAVCNATNYCDAMRKLGAQDRPVRTGNIVTLKKYIKTYGLDVSHFTSKPATDQRGKGGRISYGLSCLAEGSNISPTTVLRNVRKHDLLPDICAICELNPTWQGKPLTLQLDHINGNRSDHRIENLRFLCPNCHSQTLTFGNRSRSCKTEKSSQVIKSNPRPRRFEVTEENLRTMLETLSISAIGRHFGVSGTSIRKRMKLLNITKP